MGMDTEEAFSNFAKAFGEVMRDIALDVDCPRKFEREVRSFFNCIEEESGQVWQEARKRIRSGEQSVSGNLDDLKRIEDDFDTSISIIIITDTPGIKGENIILEEDIYSTAA